MNWNAFKRLFHYLGRYKLRLILVMIAAVCLRTFMRGLSASRRAACILPRGCTEAAGHDNSRGL